ncbi:efflux transporter outer membrane subunit [Propionivibrio limicola]|uniref:efflux transporter outer membrane subunit n=1 Tax=Propionivibrio limicola TaxID=167645 RepID=UPI00147916B8|nr:efflux transporter outer membrane subunit [Propionivibrio limicola]
MNNYRHSHARNRLAALLGAAFLAGCAVGPDYERPAFQLPERWSPAKQENAATALRPADSAGERWWSLFADPVLDALIAEALVHNADAKIAAARVLEARALSNLADTSRYPTVSAGFNANRTKSSELGTYPLGTMPRIQNDHVATLDVSYELDLWGKYRRASEAARADLFAAESARESVRLSLTAQVAQQYFTLIAADGQVAIAKRTLASRSETLALFTKRFAAGTLSEYALHQQVAEHAATRSQLATLQQAHDRAESALTILLGRSPREVMERTIERGKPAAVADLIVPAGLPSELLLRRPDLREAEQQLVAANARIGNARAEYFPSLGLTGYLGSESTSFSELFSGPASTFNFAANITQPIWNAGRIDANVEAAEARRDQALAQYQRAVANAFKDVRDALAAQAAASETLDAETTRAAALEKALRQAKLQFDAGIASRLDVLDVERNLLSAELARIDSERARKAALADIFKALGGGWSETGVKASAKPHSDSSLTKADGASILSLQTGLAKEK